MTEGGREAERKLKKNNNLTKINNLITISVKI
jgi:hypothetical protein